MSNNVQKRYSGVFGYNMLDSNSVEIVEYIGREDTVIIPEVINGLIVSQVGYNAFGGYDSRKVVKKVIIPPSVERICENAFYNCELLNEIIIPESVIEIERFAFANCLSLESICLPDELVEIGEYAFSGCKNLTTVLLPERLTKINRCVFYECVSLDFISLPSALKSIGTGAFQNCTKLSMVMSLSEGLEEIEPAAFYNCSSLSDVDFLDGVVCIGESAFAKCTSLVDVFFPDSLIGIFKHAFKDCSSLERIGLGSNLCKISDGSFSGCEKLCMFSVHPDNSEFAVANGALFHKATRRLLCFPAGFNVESYVIPRGTVSVAGEAFAGLSSLKRLVIPRTVESITAYSLIGCDNLEIIEVDPAHPFLRNNDGVLFDVRKKELVYYPRTISLATYDIPNDTVSIGEWAFSKNPYLTTVIFPKTVICVNDRAFSNCTKLASCILPNSLSKLGSYVFNGCHCLEETCIPPKISTIPTGTFAACYALKRISLPDSVKTIETGAFMLCSSLVDIRLSKTLNAIHDKAFGFCHNLKKLLLPASLSTIDADAFFVCDALSVEVYENSYAKAFAVKNKVPYSIAAPTTDETEPFETHNKMQFQALFELIGLQEIKEEVRNLVEFVSMQKMRVEQGLKASPISLHMVFTGNPGTGKTSVARIIAELYKEIGILEKGQLVEVDRSGLVAGYVGQTAIKTQEKINEAKGGILFIDEAYTLVKDGHDFGQEAIDTILKAMEDNRDSFIVIVAGYQEPMRKFINSNQGLKSRFNKYFDFPDYTLEELVQIFMSICKKNDYRLSPNAESVARKHISNMLNHKDENFANAREIRNYFESAIQKQAVRLSRSGSRNIDELMSLVEMDLI